MYVCSLTVSQTRHGTARHGTAHSDSFSPSPYWLEAFVILSLQAFALHWVVLFSLLWTAFHWAVLLSLPENMPSTGTVKLRLGSLNLGVNQSMFTGKNVRKVLDKISDVVATCVQEPGLHMFSFCELGGHGMGLQAANIDYRDMKVFKEDIDAQVSANYMTAWNLAADASQLSVRPTGTPTIYNLSRGYMYAPKVADPQFVVMTFHVGADAGLIHGNLHITTSSRQPKQSTRRRLLVEALRILESTPPPIDSDGAAQPVAYVLVGDPNLSKAEAEIAVQAFQPNGAQWDTVWQVFETRQQRDILLVKGARACVLDLPVSPGIMANDGHDAIGVEVRFYARGAFESTVQAPAHPSRPRPSSIYRSSSHKRAQEQQLYAPIAKKRNRSM